MKVYSSQQQYFQSVNLQRDKTISVMSLQNKLYAHECKKKLQNKNKWHPYAIIKI